MATPPAPKRVKLEIKTWDRQPGFTKNPQSLSGEGFLNAFKQIDRVGLQWYSSKAAMLKTQPQYALLQLRWFNCRYPNAPNTDFEAAVDFLNNPSHPKRDIHQHNLIKGITSLREVVDEGKEVGDNKLVFDASKRLSDFLILLLACFPNQDYSEEVIPLLESTIQVLESNNQLSGANQAPAPTNSMQSPYVPVTLQRMTTWGTLEFVDTHLPASQIAQYSFEDAVSKLKVDLSKHRDLEKIAGLNTAKEALDEFVSRSVDYEGEFRETTGFLIHGAQGTGKTILAFAFAKKHDLPCYAASTADILSMYVGRTEKMVVALFQRLRAEAPCVLIIDEVDGLLGRVENELGDMGFVHSIFKSQWKGLVNDHIPVAIIGTTVHPERIREQDFGCLFNEKLNLGPPNQSAIVQVLRQTLSETHHNIQDQDNEMIAKRLQGDVCSNIVDLVDGAEDELLTSAISTSRWKIQCPCVSSKHPHDTKVLVPCTSEDYTCDLDKHYDHLTQDQLDIVVPEPLSTTFLLEHISNNSHKGTGGFHDFTAQIKEHNDWAKEHGSLSD